MIVINNEHCPCCRGALINTVQGAVCNVCRIHRGELPRLWLRLEDTIPSGFDHDAACRLKDLCEREHFWLRERRRLIAQLLARLKGSATERWDSALELGCGSGTLLHLLEERAGHVMAMDGHGILLQQACAASKQAIIIQGDVTNTQLRVGEFDLIVALDVLEHVDADAFLAETRRLAGKGAKLLISVPAFSVLWSEVDVRAGHRCRYRWSQLKVELIRNGWQPRGYTHFQFLLFPLVYVSRHLAGVSSRKIERRPPFSLDQLLGMINYLEVTLFDGVSLPFGSSLFAWASAD